MMSSSSSSRPRSKIRTPLSARHLAWSVLGEIHQHQRPADRIFEHWIGKFPLKQQDRALAHELVQGVLRIQCTLDWRLNLIMHRPIERFPFPVRSLLRLGAYQILYLEKIPMSAAVNESVKLAKLIGGRDWSGVVNGILRNLARVETPSWPSLDDNPVQALSVRYSCPPWLVERWITQFGLDRAQRACHLSTEIPPMTLRTNTLRCTREELVASLSLLNLHPCLTPISPLGVVIEKCGTLTDMAPIQQGWCYVEDEAAQLVPLLLDVQPGHRVWDTCAAPGGKTSHLAALMHNQGEIFATDTNPDRLNILKENCERLGITNVRPVPLTILNPVSIEENSHFHQGALNPDGLEAGFDRILVDAPCSGLGTLRRHPDAKWSRKPEQLMRYQSIQCEILDGVCGYLRPGGVLVYSSCSTEPEESDQVVSTFLRNHPEFCHEVSTPWLPPLGRGLVNQDGNLLTMGASWDMDGFFAVRLRKRISA